MIKVAFFDAKPYDITSFETYGKDQDMTFRFLETKLNEDTVELARGCDAVCVFVNDDVNAAVIDKLHEFGIRLIALRSAGYNNVDIRAAFGKVHVVHVPAYSPYAVAEHAMALLLTSVRRIHKAYNRTREFNFSLSGLTGFDFHGKTVGVVGTGKIGRIFIDICRGFGMHVIAYDLFPAKDSGIDYVPLDELFERSDIISLHCPLTEQTFHLIGEKQFAMMKPNAILVNTSRGDVVDEEPFVGGRSHHLPHGIIVFGINGINAGADETVVITLLVETIVGSGRATITRANINDTVGILGHATDQQVLIANLVPGHTVVVGFVDTTAH